MTMRSIKTNVVSLIVSLRKIKMTYLKKIIFAASLAVASLGFSLPSNAALITHDIIIDFGVGDFTIGEITVHLFENGATGTQEILDFESFSFFGDDVTTTYDFLAIVDRDNVFAGIEFLIFDVDVVGFFNEAYQGIYDAFSLFPEFDNFIDVFDLSTTPPGLIFAGELKLSEARVVPEPSMLALFAVALIGFGVRRKAK